MNRISFNVLTEPWIPVIRSDGSSDQLGIVSCLEQAHNLHEIRDPAPIIEFGLYRLLVAFILDALVLAGSRPEVPLDLKMLIEQGHFDSNMLETYIDKCGEVFDLFHPEKPFLQVKMDQVELKPLAALFPAVPSGTNVFHWHHQMEDRLEVLDKEAARFLTTIAPFMTSGGAGLSPSINGAPAIYTLPVGNNLFETIVLNIPLRNQDSGEGVIAWRSKRCPGQERSHATMVEALTWQPRQIQLIPGKPDDAGNILVRAMKFKKGDSTRLIWIDSNLAYRYNKDKVTPVRMQENHPLWRDAGSLVLLNEMERNQKNNKIQIKRPDVVNHAFEIYDTNESVMINVYGMRTDMKMKIYEWIKSALSVPLQLGLSQRLGSLVQQELERAERAAYALRTAILKLSPEFEREEKKPPARRKKWDTRSMCNLADRCERAYWQHLESRFHPLMESFTSLDEDDLTDLGLIADTAKDWRLTVRRLAQEQFEIAAEDMDADGDALERQVRSRTRMNNILKEVLL
ncbi:MAG: type I-E CRISPR-associated protein Cse1/CasA [Dehalococcoidales bacterium]|nr:type I-E CRISPR-associated protein Cse1/CasA [Dehalococcoidales bacterium]